MAPSTYNTMPGADAETLAEGRPASKEFAKGSGAGMERRYNQQGSLEFLTARQIRPSTSKALLFMFPTKFTFS
jgi:hypothetical protein